MMGWQDAEVSSLAEGLINTGLSSAGPCNHMRLNPALCQYLYSLVREEERIALAARWEAALREYVISLVNQADQNTEIAATLTVLELPNLFALLEYVLGREDPVAVIAVATCIFKLIERLGRPQLLSRVTQIYDAATAALGESWSNAAFTAECTRIQYQLGRSQLSVASAGAQVLLERARSAGGTAYPGADYDLGDACWLLARILRESRKPEGALTLLQEAEHRFASIAEERGDVASQRMAGVCLAELGDWLRDLGRLDDAATAYKENIRRAKEIGDDRQIAVGKGQLGSIRLLQHHYQDALDAYEEARERFIRLNEPHSVAVFWHQTGYALREMGDADAAEEAFRQSLVLWVSLRNQAGLAATLGELGNLYDDVRDRPQEAVEFYRKAIEIYRELGDTANEGRIRNDLSSTLRRCGRLDEARDEVCRAIAFNAAFGLAAEPWTTWHILSEIELNSGNSLAAADARAKAVEDYLTYRREGGENHYDDGRIAFQVGKHLANGETTLATALIAEIAFDPNLAEVLTPFIQALEAICLGTRDPALANTPGLHFTSAAEIHLLLERLESGAV